MFARRLLVTAVGTLLLTAVLVARYFDLQISRYEDFATQSNNNRVLVRPVAPSRGLIYDRNSKLIADNRPSYNLTIVPERSEDLEKLLADLGEIVSISERDIQRFRKRLKQRRPFAKTSLRFNLSEEERAVLAVNGHRLLGAETSARLKRFYPDGELFSHVVGYVGRINERESKTIEAIKYSGTDSIGKIGLEKFYEQQLLGDVGSEQVETNALGRVTRVLDKTGAVSGDNLTLYLDSNLQQVGLEAFKDKRGALVAIEIETGGVLAMISAPSYDPNLFVSGSVKRIMTVCSTLKTGHYLIARFAASIPPARRSSRCLDLSGCNTILSPRATKLMTMAISISRALNGPGETITLPAAVTATGLIWPRQLSNPAISIFTGWALKPV